MILHMGGMFKIQSYSFVDIAVNTITRRLGLVGYCLF